MTKKSQLTMLKRGQYISNRDHDCLTVQLLSIKAHALNSCICGFY